MRVLICIGIVIPAALMLAAEGYTSLYRQAGKDFVFEDVELSGGELTFENVRKIGLEFGSRYPGISFMRVRVFRDRGLQAVLTQPRPSDEAFQSWFRRREAAQGKEWEVAEVISLGTIRSVRLRRRDGSVRVEALPGGILPQCTVATTEWRLVHLGLRWGPLEPGGPSDYRPIVFVRLKHSLPLRVLQDLALEIAPQATTYFRTDSWFVKYTGFPEYNPFGENEPAPQEETWLKSTTVRCEPRPDGMRCVQSHGQK